MAEFKASEEEKFVPREIVRVFSMRIKAEYEDRDDSGTELERALVEKAEDDESQQKKRIRQINEYLNSTRPQELAKLNQLRVSLERSMREFCAQVQKSQPQDVLPEKINSWEDVTSIVENIMNRLQQKKEKDKFRRATKHFRTFCNTIRSHSTALKMLPTNNDYVKLFYGALATVIQASESYTKVMEALPRALVEINDAVAAIEKRSWLFENDTMKSYMWRVYSQIFAFLGEVIRWYTKRSAQRLLGSFNESLLDFFDDQVEEIKKLAKLVHDEAEFRAQADAQISRLYHEEMEGKLDRFMGKLLERDSAQHDIVGRRFERFYEEMEQKRRDELSKKETLENILVGILNKIKKQETGAAMSEILEGDARKRLAWPEDAEYIQRVQDNNTSRPGHVFESHALVEQGLEDSYASEITRDALLLSSSGLEDYFDRAKLVIPGTFENNTAVADPEVADRIRLWMMTNDSQILYTSSSDPFGESPQASGTAGQYASVIREAGLPVCSYSCSLEAKDPPKGRTRETMELGALVYSIIRQLIEILPPIIESNTTLIQNFRWDNLDGTLRTFPRALEVLEWLLCNTGHAVIFIIIDAIDLLDDPTRRSTDKWLACLVQLFRKLLTISQSTTFKIWFNSGGMSPILFNSLERHQIAISTSSTRSGKRAFGSEVIMM
ncbi:hypothetical protein COCSADRAFT_188607 [Bipolaris sorokiniana ND90Pr]|uniref:DUF7708 domain-containing protein n=1 Tax=Cochliobolus sativus (strain ND90Pr / ATCC 201652) TaxID=665912 RepID=M2SV77_COCSN|nr:uncharacterized protein COCSADRAFT_188607 [Bipolaris sorokiniana ND90Pr]EMD66205.1 hypothetical protein COCSADRAFT_188607 [Bipolaris sorokiniana ND90Pr]